MDHHPHIAYCLAALLFLPGASHSAEPGKNPATSRQRSSISFNRDIRPIFSETCFHWHGPDAASREAELRVDVPASALAERDGGDHAIVPGDPEASQAWVLINDSDPDHTMPPKSSDMLLSVEQKTKIKTWIEEDAHFERHWAFIAPVKKSPSPAHDKGWSRNAIDRFIEERLIQAYNDDKPFSEFLREQIEDQSTHIRDINATVLHCMGIHHETFTIRHRGLDQRLTGVEPSRVVKEILT